MRRWGCPPLLAFSAASRAAGALAAPLLWRYYRLFDPTHYREAQRRSIGFREYSCQDNATEMHILALQIPRGRISALQIGSQWGVVG